MAGQYLNADPAPDLGADGPANAARPSRMVRVALERQTSAGRTGTDARCYSDTTLHDRMHDRGQLSDKQHGAANELYRLWTDAGLNRSATSRYGEARGRSLNSDGDAPSAFDLWLRAARGLRHAWLVVDMLGGKHPGAKLSTLQDSLDAFATDVGIDQAQAGWE